MGVSPAVLDLTSIGESAQLTATVTDQMGRTLTGATVNWTSEATDVVSVSATGLATAVSEGRVTVTASSGRAEGTAAVSVNQVVASLSLSHERVLLEGPGGAEAVSATARDAEGTEIGHADIRWISADESVAQTGPGGLVTAVGSGTTTVTAHATAGGQTRSRDVGVTVGDAALVSPEGAALSLVGGAVSLELSPGAVTEPVFITVRPAAALPPGPQPVPGTAFEFGPSGIVFDVPVNLTIRYDPERLPETMSEGDLTLAELVDGLYRPSDGSEVDVAGKTLSASITGFSVFAVVEELEVSTSALPDGVEGIDYGPAELSATGGGGGTYDWSVVSGSLPVGLSLDGSTGEITGVPTRGGASDFTVEVGNGVQTARRQLSIAIQPPGLPLVVSTPASTFLTGDTLQLTVRTSEGEVLAPTEVTWVSDDPQIATVTADGRAIGLGAGRARIRASRNGGAGATDLTVWLGRGRRVPGMASYDRLIPELMDRWGIPGGAVAVMKDGRLVYARSYGLADTEAGEAVEPTDLFRVASVSKPITAAAVLLLVEQGLITLDEPAFAWLDDLEAPAGTTRDPRLDEITIRQLLLHAGGWDRDASFDPMFRSDEAADAVGVPRPADTETVIRWMLGQPLQFDPGLRYAYSNFGYAVLGRIIERASGMPYERFVQEELLAPAGAERMVVGRSRLAQRLADEVRYYADGTARSVFPDEGLVPWPYGGFHLEAMDSHGGWVASTVDLLRFVGAVDGLPVPPDLLAAGSVATMVARPDLPVWAGSAYYYGLGWLVRPTLGDANWWHDGSLPGTTALVVRNYDGVTWAALFNRRESNQNGSFAGALDGLLWDALRGVEEWPDHDLFQVVR